MIYSNKEIGKRLKDEINKGYNITRISNWADDLFINMHDKRIPEIEDILHHIFMMDAGPEFEYTEQELRLLAELLIKEEKDPIKQINNMKLKNDSSL